MLQAGNCFRNGGKAIYGRPPSRRQANSQSRPAQIDRRRRHALARPWKSATTAGKFPPARTRVRALGAIAAAGFMSVGSRSAALKRRAGIYYSYVKDDWQKLRAPRRLVQANTAPEVLYNNLAVGEDDTVLLGMEQPRRDNRAQIFMRTIAADDQTWSPIQQISHAKATPADRFWRCAKISCM